MALTPEERQAIMSALNTGGEEEPRIKYKEWQDPADGSIWAVDDQYNKIKMLAGPTPGWEYNKGVPPPPPRAPQRAPQTQAEIDADAARARLYGAQATKAERDLQNPYVLQQQQIAETIQSIQDQMARGEITPDEGTKMMLLARQNLDAAMRGTTPYQMENDRLTREQTRRAQQQTVAQRLIDSQGQLGGSLTTGLVNGLGGIYGRINSSAFDGEIMNPLDLVRTVMEQYGGGAELANTAKGILTSLFQPQQGGM